VGRRSLRSRCGVTALSVDLLEQPVEGGDELLDALAFERGDDVFVVDADGAFLQPTHGIKNPMFSTTKTRSKAPSRGCAHVAPYAHLDRSRCLD
jgi:hypothetical protein